MASIGPTQPTAREVVVVPLPDFGPTGLFGRMAAGEAALVIVRPAIARFLVLEPAVRKGEDPDAVHDMRVASRRIRTALRLFRPVLPGWSDGLRTELGWAADLLGDVRDMDVQRGWISSDAEELGAKDRGVLEPVDEAFKIRRGTAHRILVTGLDSPRFERLRGELAAFARGPGLSSAEAERPFEAITPPLVEKRFRAMRRTGRSLGPHSSSAKLHALRIRGKRARYAIEFVAPLYGKPAESLARRISKLQDVLGDMRDAELAASRLRDMADGEEIELPANAGFVLGGLAERSARRARKLRKRFPDTFAATQGRRWKELRKTMAERLG